jgi:hypothetical protein
MRLASILLACSFLLVARAAAGPDDIAADTGPAVSFKDPFMGTWEGCISDWPFSLELRQAGDETKATIRFSGCPPEALTVMGWKEKYQSAPVLYLWRSTDMAALAVFPGEEGLVLAYHERDSVRRSILAKARPAGDPPEKLLEKYRGSTALPPRLLEMYADLVGLFAEGKPEAIRKLCATDGITVTDMPREQANMGKPGEINLPFLKDGFDRSIQVVSQDSETECLLRTNSTALWFTLTPEGTWMLRDYLDKPIK